MRNYFALIKTKRIFEDVYLSHIAKPTSPVNCSRHSDLILSSDREIARIMYSSIFIVVTSISVIVLAQSTFTSVLCGVRTVPVERQYIS